MKTVMTIVANDEASANAEFLLLAANYDSARVVRRGFNEFSYFIAGQGAGAPPSFNKFENDGLYFLIAEFTT